MKDSHMRRYLVTAAAALALAGCNDHSLTLDLTPNPLVVGLVDTRATVHAHAVAKGFGKVPITSLQFAVYNGSDSLLASQTEEVDKSLPASPFGITVDRDFTFPINGAVVALSGMKYVMVRVLGPAGDVVAERRLDIVVHALKDLPVPPVLQPAPAPSNH
jgi:putative VirB-like lipoprotein